MRGFESLPVLLKMWRELDIEPEERCLGQITRTQIKPEIIEKRGDCRICFYHPDNDYCIVYQDPKNRVSVWIYEVVEEERG